MIMEVPVRELRKMLLHCNVQQVCAPLQSFYTSQTVAVSVQLAGDEAQQAKQREAVQKCLEPMRQTLQNNKWLGGSHINYADITVAGTFMVSVYSTLTPS